MRSATGAWEYLASDFEVVEIEAAGSGSAVGLGGVVVFDQHLIAAAIDGHGSRIGAGKGFSDGVSGGPRLRLQECGESKQAKTSEDSWS